MKKKRKPNYKGVEYKMAPLDIDRSIIEWEQLYLLPKDTKIKMSKGLALQINQWVIDSCPIQDGKYMGISNLKFLWSLYIKELYDGLEEKGDEENMEFIMRVFNFMKQIFVNKSGQFFNGPHRDTLKQKKK